MQGTQDRIGTRVRRARIAQVLSAALVLAAAPAGEAGAKPPPAGGGGVAESVTGELIVGFHSSATASQRSEARRRAGVRAKRELAVRGSQLVQVEDGDTDGAAARLRRDPNVRYVEPNRIVEPTATLPNDPMFTDGGLWGLHHTALSQAIYGGTVDADIDAPEAWDVSTGSSDVIVAIADTGVWTNHPDLADRIWTNPGETPGNGVDDDRNGYVDDVHGWNTFDRNASVTDTHGHGTHVAGTVGATGNNGIGVTGVSWSATLMPVKVLNPHGSDVSVGDGFDYAADNGADIVNASLGCSGCPPSIYVTEVIRSHPSTLFVVAAGNDTNDVDVRGGSPCNIEAPNLICVAATDPADKLAGFSNFGDVHVDLGAPGVNVLSTGLRTSFLRDTFDADQMSPNFEREGPWSLVEVDANNNYMEIKDSAGTLTTSEVYDLSGLSGCRLSWNMSLSLSTSTDRLYVERSTNGTDWTSVLAVRSTPGWIHWYDTIPASEGTRVRFRVDYTEGTGRVGIDEPSISCTGGANATAIMGGTSMASPHVAGAAAVLLGAKPAATVAALRTALLDGGDPVAALTGKTVTGRRLNLNGTLQRAGGVPSATDDTFTHNGSDTALMAGSANSVLTNDSDPDDDGLTASVVSGPQHGTLTLNPDGSFEYQPNAAFVGSDGFTYAAADAFGNSETAAVSIVVSAGCNGLPATIVGTAAGEKLTGTPQADVISGLGGNDTIVSQSGDDVVCGDSGDDTINVSSGDDYVDAGSGDDTVRGDLGADRLMGGTGDDTLSGDEGDDSLFGGAGRDVCRGDAGTDAADGCERVSGTP